MPQTKEEIKAMTVRFPESFWDRAKIAAHHKRVSLQRALVLGCAAYLEIEPPVALDGEDESETVPTKPEEPKRRRA